MPVPMQPSSASEVLTVHALLLGERLEHRGLERLGPSLAGAIALAPGGPGHAFAFRWGALVTIGVDAATTTALAARLRTRLHDPLPQPVEETALIGLNAPEGEPEEGPDAAGVIRLRDFSAQRLALVAENLAKSAVLSDQEAALARTLDRLDPIVARLRRGRLATSSAALLTSIGEALAARSRAAARVDTAAKPDLLWDHPNLGALHLALAAEWELEERSEALDRKLALIREMSETVLSLVEARRSRGLELAVVLLIATEAITALYGLFGG
jgi:uncharacterized Rmd1/YagE family protein